MKTLIIALLVIFFSLFVISAEDKPPVPLDCDYSKQVLRIAMANHIDFNSESPELEKRAVESFIYRIDPFLSVALESEVEELKALALKHPLFLDLKGDCKTILPKFYDLFLKVNKRYSEITVEVAKNVTQKEIEAFKISKYENKYKTRAKNLNELKERIKVSTLKLIKYLKATDVSFKTVKENFVKDIDKALEKISKNTLAANGTADDQHDKYEFIVSSFINAFDAHSAYIPFTQFTQNEEEFNKGYFFGIGILIGKEKYKGIKVKEVYKNGPAGKEGTLKLGDIIYKVNGTNVIDLPLEDGVKLIKGPKGTKVNLDFIRTIKDEVKKMSVTLERNKVFFTESIKVKLETVGDKKIAFIQLDQFFRDAAQGVYQKFISEIGAKKIDGILLDLSGNGGGLLKEAVDLTDLFIDRGPVVATKTSANRIAALPAETPGELAKKVPMVVLVNKFSASASEIVTGALKDYNRAIVVGNEHTFGKGSVQDVIPLESGKRGGLHITIAKYFRPNGDSTQLRGVISDINLPGLAAEDFEGENDQLFPVSFEKIKPLISPSSYYTFDYVKYLPKLVEQSKKRVAKNKIFSELSKERSDINYELIEKEQPFVKEGLNILADLIDLMGKQDTQVKK